MDRRPEPGWLRLFRSSSRRFVRKCSENFTGSAAQSHRQSTSMMPIGWRLPTPAPEQYQIPTARTRSLDFTSRLRSSASSHVISYRPNSRYPTACIREIEHISQTEAFAPSCSSRAFDIYRRHRQPARVTKNRSWAPRSSARRLGTQPTTSGGVPKKPPCIKAEAGSGKPYWRVQMNCCRDP